MARPKRTDSPVKKTYYLGANSLSKLARMAKGEKRDEGNFIEVLIEEAYAARKKLGL